MNVLGVLPINLRASLLFFLPAVFLLEVPLQKTWDEAKGREKAIEADYCARSVAVLVANLLVLSYAVASEHSVKAVLGSGITAA